MHWVQNRWISHYISVILELLDFLNILKVFFSVTFRVCKIILQFLKIVFIGWYAYLKARFLLWKISELFVQQKIRRHILLSCNYISHVKMFFLPGNAQVERSLKMVYSLPPQEMRHCRSLKMVLLTPSGNATLQMFENGTPYPLRECDTADEDGPRVHVRTLCLLQSQHFLPGNIHYLEGAYIEENPRTGSRFPLFCLY